MDRPVGRLALLLVVLASAACTPRPHEVATAPLNWASAGESQIVTGVPSPSRVQLHRGRWERDAGTVREQVQLLDQPRFGDLDGDGAEDAVGVVQVRRFGVHRARGQAPDATPFVRTVTALVAFRNDRGLAVPSRNALPLPTDGQVPELVVRFGRIRVTYWRDGRPTTRTARYQQDRLRWLTTAG